MTKNSLKPGQSIVAVVVEDRRKRDISIHGAQAKKDEKKKKTENKFIGCLGLSRVLKIHALICIVIQSSTGGFMHTATFWLVTYHNQCTVRDTA